MKKIFFLFGIYLAILISCLIILSFTNHLFKVDLSIPFGYGGGDGVAAISIFKGVIDNNWYYENPYLGMPVGQHFYDYPMVESLTFLLAKFFSVFSSDYAVIVNLIYLSGFFLTAIASFAVLKHFKISFVPALVISLLYSFFPYHFTRGLGHFFLGLYFMIPLGTMVVLWIFSRNDLLFSYDDIKKKSFFNLKSKMFWIAVLICLGVSSTGIYYALFTAFFMMVAGLSSLALRRSYNLFNALILIGVIASGVLANVAPNLIYQSTHGNNRIAA